jgi:hypothetical protein
VATGKIAIKLFQRYALALTLLIQNNHHNPQGDIGILPRELFFWKKPPNSLYGQ